MREYVCVRVFERESVCVCEYPRGQTPVVALPEELHVDEVGGFGDALSVRLQKLSVG